MPAEDSASSKSRQIPIVCPGHTRPLAEVNFCTPQAEDETRTFLVSACHDKLPMLRDGTTGDWIGTFAGHKGAVWSCKLDPLGLLAATASGDFSCKVWDAITGKELYNFAHKHICKTCDFSPNSIQLATGGHEGILRIYNLKQPKKDPLQIVQSPESKVTITKCSFLDEITVLAAGSDGAIRFWKVPAESNKDSKAPDEPMLILKVDAEVRDMELSKSILTVAAGSKVSFFSLETHKLLYSHSMPMHFREEGGASLHPSAKKFVAGGSDLWVRVFDFETGEELETHKGHHGPIRCVRYAPDGATYATGSEDGTIRLWKTDPEK